MICLIIFIIISFNLVSGTNPEENAYEWVGQYNESRFVITDEHRFHLRLSYIEFGYQGRYSGSWMKDKNGQLILISDDMILMNYDPLQIGRAELRKFVFSHEENFLILKKVLNFRNKKWLYLKYSG